MTRAAPASLVVRAVSHRYPAAERLALADVGFEVEPGTRVGLLGTNGAGKTTLMRLVCGSLALQGRDWATRIEVDGIDVARRSMDARRRLGYLPEQVPVYAELRVHEHLAFRAAIKGVPRRRRAGEVDRVAELVGLREVLRTPILRLSRGYRQRVGIADALLGAPPLLVLDEPTVGLDPNQIREIRGVLRDLVERQTLVLSSHALAEVEALCDRVVILSHGRVVADEPVEDAVEARTAEVVWEGEVSSAREVVAAIGGSPDPVHADGASRVRASVACPDGMSMPELLAAIGRESARLGLVVVRLEPARRRLEERFSQVTAETGERA